MENLGDGVNSQNSHTFQTMAEVERYLFSPDEIDPSINHDQIQENNDQSAQGESDDAPCPKKGRWSFEEDRKLLSLVKKHGRKWARISREMDGCGREHCSARWNNHLRPGIKKKDKWSKEEEMFFIEAHQIFGNRWSEISKIIPGRSENSIKNHWHATKRKQLSILKRMNSTEATMLGDYISTKILKQTNDPTKNATPTTNSTSDDHSKYHEIPLPIQPPTLTDELVFE